MRNPSVPLVLIRWYGKTNGQKTNTKYEYSKGVYKSLLLVSFFVQKATTKAKNTCHIKFVNSDVVCSFRVATISNNPYIIETMKRPITIVFWTVFLFIIES